MQNMVYSMYQGRLAANKISVELLAANRRRCMVNTTCCIYTYSYCLLMMNS
jgi:hypothetical protein